MQNLYHRRPCTRLRLNSVGQLMVVELHVHLAETLFEVTDFVCMQQPVKQVVVMCARGTWQHCDCSFRASMDRGLPHGFHTSCQSTCALFTLSMCVDGVAAQVRSNKSLSACQQSCIL